MKLGGPAPITAAVNARLETARQRRMERVISKLSAGGASALTAALSVEHDHTRLGSAQAITAPEIQRDSSSTAKSLLPTVSAIPRAELTKWLAHATMAIAKIKTGITRGQIRGRGSAGENWVQVEVVDGSVPEMKADGTPATARQIPAAATARLAAAAAKPKVATGSTGSTAAKKGSTGASTATSSAKKGKK